MDSCPGLATARLSDLDWQRWGWGGLSGPQPPYLCSGDVTLRADPGGPNSEARRWCQESTEPGRCCLIGLFFLPLPERGKEAGSWLRVSRTAFGSVSHKDKGWSQRGQRGRPQASCFSLNRWSSRRTLVCGHVSPVPGNPFLSLPVTLLSNLLVSGALVTFQCLGVFLQASQTSKMSANRIQGVHEFGGEKCITQACPCF